MTPAPMPTADASIADAPTGLNPTIWGLTPVELHDRFWAARGVQVVRTGEASEIVEDAELFLLLAPSLLTIFRLRPLINTLSWLDPLVLRVRVSDDRLREYTERAVTDHNGYFLRYERQYRGTGRLARVALTPERRVARLWQTSTTVRQAWARLRHEVPRPLRATATLSGRTCQRDDDRQVAQFVRDLVHRWKRPDVTIDRARRLAAGVWGDVQAGHLSRAQCVAPVWLGAGRQLDDEAVVVGPAVLWDAPASRPAAAAVNWNELEPGRWFAVHITPARRQPGSVSDIVKRAFDICFALAALLICAPIFPAIMFAILVEDGRPVIFAHERETRGGRPFPCFKFRSMRKDAERIKAQLVAQNQVDGPQFHMADDPRVTRVGKVLRRFHLDELPQFVNVLLGHMSVVGPRPSPFEENQFCPPWRDARLSVRPGVTGLWQVMRTRRAGLDFQEWIRYDVQYVEKQSLLLDLWIIWRTVVQLLSRR